MPLALFIQISLAIHTSPSAQPAMNRSVNQTGTLGKRHEQQNGCGKEDSRDDATLETEAHDHRGYRGPHRITAIKLAADHRADRKTRIAQPAQDERNQRAAESRR